MKPIADRILYEDNHLIVVNKLPSEIVQGDKTGDVCLLDDVKAYIKEKYDKPGNVFAGLVHRIDRPVSGAVVFAKTSKALSRMTVKVKDRDFHKVYLAIVQHRPPKDADILEDYLVKNEKQNKSYVVPAGTKEAKLARLSGTVGALLPARGGTFHGAASSDSLSVGAYRLPDPGRPEIWLSEKQPRCIN